MGKHNISLTTYKKNQTKQNIPSPRQLPECFLNTHAHTQKGVCTHTTKTHSHRDFQKLPIRLKTPQGFLFANSFEKQALTMVHSSHFNSFHLSFFFFKHWTAKHTYVIPSRQRLTFRAHSPAFISGNYFCAVSRVGNTQLSPFWFCGRDPSQGFFRRYLTNICCWTSRNSSSGITFIWTNRRRHLFQKRPRLWREHESWWRVTDHRLPPAHR